MKRMLSSSGFMMCGSTTVGVARRIQPRGGADRAAAVASTPAFSPARPRSN
jgi:hypothetical protein